MTLYIGHAHAKRPWQSPDEGSQAFASARLVEMHLHQTGPRVLPFVTPTPTTPIKLRAASLKRLSAAISTIASVHL
jgi:hypothetical protein